MTEQLYSDIQKLSPKEGDLIVVTAPDGWTADHLVGEFKRLFIGWKDMFPEHFLVVIVLEGVKMALVEKERIKAWLEEVEMTEDPQEQMFFSLTDEELIHTLNVLEEGDKEPADEEKIEAINKELVRRWSEIKEDNE